ncbi:Spo0E family sporulation regulatory protein-aspartic acid phosphatase [Cohnella faecalis]
MNSDELIHRLQLLQRRLYEMADDLGNLTDPEIIAVSEEADRLIVQLQRIRMNEASSRRAHAFRSETLLSAAQPPEEGREQRPAFFVKHS